MAAVVSALPDRSHPEGILARQARRESSARTYPRNLPLALIVTAGQVDDIAERFAAAVGAAERAARPGGGW